MRPHAIHVVALCAMVVFSAGAAHAQQEQWLNYATADELYQAIGTAGHQSMTITEQAPEGLALPKFTSDKPLFFLWKLSLDKAQGRAAKDGGVWLALDQSRSKGPYDVLYADTKLEGSLASAKVIKATDVHDYGTNDGSFYARFKHITFQLPSADGPVDYRISVQYSQRPPQESKKTATSPAFERRAYVASSCWYEGQVTVGDSKLWCILVDRNVNGRFDDVGSDYEKCDIIRIAPKGDESFRSYQTDTTTRYLGKYVQVDQKFYPITVSPDGSSIKIGPAQKPAMGKLRLPKEAVYFSAFGTTGHIFAQPTDGVLELPVGKYHVNKWKLSVKDKDGVAWQAFDDNCVQEPVFTIEEGKETAIDFGMQFRWVSSADKGEEGWSINQTAKTLKGDSISITRLDQQPPEPKVRILSADGGYDKAFTMEYG